MMSGDRSHSSRRAGPAPGRAWAREPERGPADGPRFRSRRSAREPGYAGEFDAFHRGPRRPVLEDWYGEPEAGRARGRRGAGEEPLFPPALLRRYAPRKPVRGYDPRGIHTYDLDYGRQAGGPTEYSGRAGYPTPDPAAPGDMPPAPTMRGRRRTWRGRMYRGEDYGPPRRRSGPPVRRLRERRRGPAPARAEPTRHEPPDEGRQRRRGGRAPSGHGAPRYERRHWSAAEPAGARDRGEERRDRLLREGDRAPFPGRRRPGRSR